MQEIKLLREKLQIKRDGLMSSTYDTVDRNLMSFIDFLQKDSIIAKIIESINFGEFDWSAWELGLKDYGLGGKTEYGIPIDDAKAAKFCYILLDRNKENVWQIAGNIYVSSGNIDDITRKFFEIFVPPLYSYLDWKLQEVELMISPTDIAREIVADVDGNEIYHLVTIRLSEAYKKLYVAKTNDDYIAISNICRALLIDFAGQIYEERYLPIGEEAPQADNAKAKLKYAYSFLQKDKKSNFEKGRSKIIDGLWQMISSNVHRKNILKSEIEECVLLTYLTIKIFIELKQC